MELGNVFYEFALLLTAAGVLGFVAHWLKQPLIVAFIAVGILVGPAGLKWVTIGSEIDLLAKTGIALLLFTVGLKLDLHLIRTMGLVSLATGLGQVVFTSGIGLLIVVGLLMRFVLPTLFRRAARSTELLTALAIAWAVALAAIGDWLGFSKEVGAFLAGVSLAPMPHREAIGSRLVGLRDFLLLFFFVDLGAHLKLSVLGPQLFPSLVLSVFVLVGNPLIVMVIMGAMGYRKRTGFLAGLTVAQISEFSLMLAALGKSLGHISGDVVALITLVGLVTITLSTYLIIYSHPIYERLARALSWFERKNPFREVAMETTTEPRRGFDVIVFGLGRFGNHISRELAERERRVLGVDFDPDLVHRLREADHAVVYGDAEDPEFASTLPLSSARWVVSSVPQLAVNLALLQALSRHGYSGQIATTAYNDRDAERLRDAGSDLILLPFLDAAKEAVDELCGFVNSSPIDESLSSVLPPEDSR